VLAKKEIIEATPRMRDLLTPQALPDDGYTVLSAKEYIAVGCDLRDINGLNVSMESSRPDQCLVLCVAEVSLVYMNPDTSDALIEWAAHLSSGKSSKLSTRGRIPSEGGRQSLFGLIISECQPMSGPTLKVPLLHVCEPLP
jgi:hypothetical protein